MKSIKIDLNNSIQTKQLDQYQQIITQAIHHVSEPYPFVSILTNDDYLKSITQHVQLKKELHPELIIVVGIGGSNLGIVAVVQALFGNYYNHNRTPTIYFADTTDPQKMHSLLAIATSALQANKKMLLNVISKSGTTTETLVNFELLLNVLKRYQPNDYGNFIVVSTDKDSPLWHLAQQHCWTVLEIPHELGGRFCLFSAAGLFALAMCNVDVTLLVQGAQSISNDYAQQQHNPAITSAAWLYNLIQQRYHTTNLFLFSDALSGVGAWWRQLVAESLGKQKKLNGSPNTDALLPIVSIGPTDLHSIGQLYFANIIPMSTTFITYDATRHDNKLSKQMELMHNMYNQSSESITAAIFMGVQKAYTKTGLAYRTIHIPEQNAYYIGQLLQHFMFEIVYLSYIMNVNPFDQPAVELYKQETRKILNNE